jgi:hypothetical protein
VRCRQQKKRKILANIFPQTAQKVLKTVFTFYISGQLKYVVYSVQFHQRILDACHTISTRTEILEIARQSMIRRVHPCIDPIGTHFDHFL